MWALSRCIAACEGHEQTLPFGNLKLYKVKQLSLRVIRVCANVADRFLAIVTSIISFVNK